MSSTQFSFKAKVKIGDEIVPLASEVVVGDSAASSGVENGFLFKLDLQPGDPPVLVNLGGIVEFVEEKLGAGTGSLAANPGVTTLQQVFPEQIPHAGDFSAANSTYVNIQSFIINSTKKQFLFSISVDIVGSDPATGLITLPGELNQWLKIQDLAISFTATKKQDS